MAGISRSTLFQWMRDGDREKTPELKQFSDAIKRGKALGEAMFVMAIDRAGKNGCWQADAWLLERMYPERYGRRSAKEIALLLRPPEEVEATLRQRLEGLGWELVRQNRAIS